MKPMKSPAFALVIFVATPLSVGTLVTITPAISFAADDTQTSAHRAFSEATRAFSAGDYARAAKLFEEAYSLRPHPSTLANAAKSRRLMGDLPAAANHYKRLLEEGSSSQDTDEARMALSELGPVVGRIAVHLPSSLTSPSVDGTPMRGIEVFVSSGEHVIEASSVVGGSGSRVKRTARVAAGEVVVVSFDDPSPSATTPSTSTSSTPTPPDEDRADRRSSGGGGGGVSPYITLAGVGLTLAAVGIATWSGIDTLNQRSAWDDSPSNRALDAGLDKQRRTNVLIGVSVGLGALTGVLAIFTSWHASPSPANRVDSRPRIFPTRLFQ